MTIAPIRPTQTASLPTWSEVQDRPDRVPLVALSLRRCECDPNNLTDCTPCAVRSEIAWKRYEDR